jgi:uncharacterized membrane protein HdeD (DUF308 family)
MIEESTSDRTKAIGIATIILGVLAVLTPFVAGETMLVIIGILMTVAGVLRVIWTFASPTPGKGFSKVLLGVLTVIAGLTIMADPMLASGTLSILLAAYLLMDGIVEVIVAMTLEGTPGRGWLLTGGLVSVCLGCLMFFQYPFSGVHAIGVLLGTKLVMVGSAALTLGTTLHEYMKEKTAE